MDSCLCVEAGYDPSRHCCTMIYLDNNATTAVDPLVKEAMLPFLGSAYANPSSPYAAGREASMAIARSREQVAELLGVSPGTLTFTSCGTESNNTALNAALGLRPNRRHVVTSRAEHASVIQYIRCLETTGYRVSYLPVQADGRLDSAHLASEISEETAVVSLMTANNETGAVWPADEYARIAQERGALFHTDAVQAAGKLPLRTQQSPIDFLCVSGHKFHALKGIGCLYVREGLKIAPYLVGGDQERGLRAGTENVPGIAGIGAAAECARQALPKLKEVASLRDRLEQGILDRVPRVIRTIGDGPRLPNTAHLMVEDIESEALLALLDMEGICCSSGSACASGSSEPSHVLEAMGVSKEKARGALRLSLSRFNMADEVEYVIERFPSLIDQLRGA